MAPPKVRVKTGGEFCSAPNCQNARYKIACKRWSFFRFPRDQARCDVWKQNCRRADLMTKTAEEMRTGGYSLCPIHFEDNQFNRPDKKDRLVFNAVPTIFDVPNPSRALKSTRPSLKTRHSSQADHKRKKRCMSEKSKFQNGNSVAETTPLIPDVHQEHTPSFCTQSSVSAQDDQEGFTQSSVNAQAQLSDSTAQRKSSLLKGRSVKGQASLSEMRDQLAWVSILMDRKVYTLWRQIKHGSFQSDTDIASFLLNYYDQNREAPSSCTRCSCPLSHLCTGQENVDMTVKKPKQEHEEEVKEEDIDKPGLTPSCELSPEQHGGVTPDNLSAVDTFIKLEIQSDQATEYMERAIKTQEEILKETISDDQPGPKNWTTIELSGNVYIKWREVKGRLLLTDHNQLATFLLRVFNEEARPGCVKCASPLWDLCAACLQRSVEGDHGENDNTSTLVSLDMKLMGHESLSVCTKPELCLVENTEWEQSSVKHLDNFACRDNETVSMSDLENCPNNMESCRQIDFKESAGTREHKDLIPKCCLFVENEAQTEGIQSNIKGKRKWKKKYFCKFCLKVFLSLDELRVHRKADHVAEYKQKRVKKSVSCLQSSTSKKEKMSHLKKKYRLCDRCGLMMTSCLSTHMRVHTQEKPHECNVCHRTFTQSSSLAKHKQTHTQLGNRTHRCSTCGKMVCLNSLQYHQLVHTNQRPFHCPTCGRAFSAKGNLVRHRLVHTGEKPYMCDICGDRFSQSNTVQIHKKVHSDSYRTQMRRRRGSEMQKSNTCPVCGKTFSHHGNLYPYKLTHSNCRQFLCYLCGKSFNSQDNITAHEKSHL